MSTSIEKTTVEVVSSSGNIGRGFLKPIMWCDDPAFVTLNNTIYPISVLKRMVQNLNIKVRTWFEEAERPTK